MANDLIRNGTMAGEARKPNCSAQREICEKLWTSEFKTMNERINGIREAQKVQANELERRMHESNDIKKDFGTKLTSMNSRLIKMETWSIVYVFLMGIGFTVLQIVLRVWKVG